MPCTAWTRSIKGPDDTELGIARASPLVYHCNAPESGKARGLAFVIPGFDDDVDEGALVELRGRLAAHHGLLAVSVEYHCYRSRLKDGARLDLNEEEFAALSRLCQGHLVPLLDRNSLVSALERLPSPYEFELHVVPANGDYQNFGVMQAMDHLAVLHDLQASDGVRFEPRNVIAIGAGHGGYLAHLLAKFAPNAIRAVFDSNARTSLPLSFLFGSAVGGEAPYYYHAGKVRIFPLVRTRWVRDASKPEDMSVSRQEIRSVTLPSHIGTTRLASRRLCTYRSVVSAGCPADVAREKQVQGDALREAGFDVAILSQANRDVEPSGASAAMLSALFDEHYPALLPMEGDSDGCLSSSVAYLSGDMLYSIDFDDFGVQLAIAPITRSPRRYSFY